MRKFFLIGLVLFGLSLSQPSSAQAPGFQPVGTIRQLMLGILTPTSNVIFGVPNKPPKDDKDWETVQRSALTLAEVGNLLMVPGRAKDKGEWMKFSKQLIDAGAAALNAANAKDAKSLEDIGNRIDGVCETCHAKYLPKPPE